jgi:hypothetical protein
MYFLLKQYLYISNLDKETVGIQDICLFLCLQNNFILYLLCAKPCYEKQTIPIYLPLLGCYYKQPKWTGHHPNELN